MGQRLNLPRFWGAHASRRRPRTRGESGVPDRVDPRPHREAVSSKSVQTFDAGRHSAGTDSLDLGYLSVPIPVRNVGLVSGAIVRGQFGVLRQFVLFREHESVRLERRQSRGRRRMRQVVKRGKWRAVGEPRFRRDDGRGATHASRSNPHHVPHGSTELNLHDFEVAVRCGVNRHLSADSGLAANA